MDVQGYCKSMETEMTAWKAKQYDVIRKVDNWARPKEKKYYPILKTFTFFSKKCRAEWRN